MKATARKAAYVAPAVMALKATQRAGAEFTGCFGPGSVCTVDAECCTGYACLRVNMMACNGAGNCTCQ